jgi:hypothetical protein
MFVCGIAERLAYNHAVRLVLFASVLLVSCASPLAELAKRGELGAVGIEIREQIHARQLSEAEVRLAAKATATRALETSRGASLVEAVRALAPCAPELDTAFEQIADARSEGAPEALLALYDAGLIGSAKLAIYANDPDAHYRQLGARTLVGPEFGRARRKAFLDPSPLVRRGALRAALLSPDAADEADLLDAARRDPDPYVQTTALRTLAVLPERSESATRNRVGLMWDLWNSADDSGRETLATSFVLGPLQERGGGDVLRSILTAHQGPGTIAGALAVVRRKASIGTELYALAHAALLHHLEHGSLRERRFVLGSAQVNTPELRAAVKKACTDAEPEVALLALRSYAEVDAAFAKPLLLKIAFSRSDNIGVQARAALAALKEPSVQGLLERDLKAGTLTAKRSAILALIDLERMPRAAHALADADPVLRMYAACTLIRVGSRD